MRPSLLVISGVLLMMGGSGCATNSPNRVTSQSLAPAAATGTNPQPEATAQSGSPAPLPVSNSALPPDVKTSAVLQQPALESTPPAGRIEKARQIAGLLEQLIEEDNAAVTDEVVSAGAEGKAPTVAAADPPAPSPLPASEKPAEEPATSVRSEQSLKELAVLAERLEKLTTALETLTAEKMSAGTTHQLAAFQDLRQPPSQSHVAVRTVAPQPALSPPPESVELVSLETIEPDERQELLKALVAMMAELEQRRFEEETFPADTEPSADRDRAAGSDDSASTKSWADALAELNSRLESVRDELPLPDRIPDCAVSPDDRSETGIPELDLDREIVTARVIGVSEPKPRPALTPQQELRLLILQLDDLAQRLGGQAGDSRECLRGASQ